MNEATRVAWFEAVCNGDLDIVNQLLRIHGKDIVDIVSPQGWTALCLSIFKDYYDIFDALIKYGADVNKPILGGRTPILLAASIGETFILHLLLKNGANVDVRTAFDRQTVWHSVAINNYERMLIYILEYVKDRHAFDQKDCHGRTPHWWAYRYGSWDVGCLLIRAGAKCNIRNKKDAVIIRSTRPLTVFYGILRKRMRYQHDMARLITEMVMEMKRL